MIIGLCPACGQTIGECDTIAERIRTIMAHRSPNRVTVKELSDRLSGKGTSYGNMVRYVNGTLEPGISTLIDIASLLQVRVEWLTYGSGDVR